MYSLPVIRYQFAEGGALDATDVKANKLLTMCGARLWETLKRGRVRICKLPNHNPGRNKEHPEEGLLRWTAKGVSQAAEHKGIIRSERRYGGRPSPSRGSIISRFEQVADIKKSRQWLEKAGQKDSTLIMAAQEQALSTRAIENGVYLSRQDPSCTLCKDVPEAVKHIEARCKMWAGTGVSKWLESHTDTSVLCME